MLGNLLPKMIATSMIAAGLLFSAHVLLASENGEGQVASEAGKLTLVQINDSHAYLDLHQEMFPGPDGPVYRQAGGYARIATLVQQIREEIGGNVLFCDCGDTFFGTYPAQASRGEIMVPILNTLGIEAMTPHWEFVFGPKRFEELAERLNYPVLAINIYKKDTGERLFPPYIVKQVAGLKIGLIGVAFIGRNPLDHPNVFIVTGDSGMGLTHGTIAGILLTDLMLGRENPWTKLYDPSRKTLGALGRFVKENLNLAAQYGDWLTSGDVASSSEIKQDTGAVVRNGLVKVAVYRDQQGRCHKCSAICTHLGGIVHWNDAEKTWDCPCHGSRFDRLGGVLNGPANHDLGSVNTVLNQ